MTPEDAALCERLKGRVNEYNDRAGHYYYIGDDCALDDKAAAAIERLSAEKEALRKAAEGMSAAISWLDEPFIDSNTKQPELRSRINFMVKDAAGPRSVIQAIIQGPPKEHWEVALARTTLKGADQ